MGMGKEPVIQSIRSTLNCDLQRTERMQKGLSLEPDVAEPEVDAVHLSTGLVQVDDAGDLAVEDGLGIPGAYPFTFTLQSSQAERMPEATELAQPDQTVAEHDTVRIPPPVVSRLPDSSLTGEDGSGSRLNCCCSS